MVTTILNIALWIFTLAGYAIWNLMKKTERLETIIEEQQILINQISTVIDESDRVLTEIDQRGSFSSDDEIGWFFKAVKEIQSALNQFIKK
jgi:hypothetical protein